jgi:hypothetical protein
VIARWDEALEVGRKDQPDDVLKMQSQTRRASSAV